MLNELLKGLPILDEEQLKTANKETLGALFNQISDLKDQLGKQALDVRVQLETKQNEQTALCNEVKERFGTVSINDLEALKQEKIKTVVELGEKLRILKENGVQNG